MALFLRGAIMGRKPLGKPEPGKPQFYAWFVVDPDTNEKTEVLSSDVIGAPGEILDIPIDCKVGTRKDGSLLDSVKFYARSRDGGAVETSWDVPGQSQPSQPKPLANVTINTAPPSPGGEQRQPAAVNGRA